MKIILFIMFFVMPQFSFAQTQAIELSPASTTRTPPPAGSDFSGGAADFDPSYYSPSAVHRLIQDSMRIQCHEGLCQMAMVDTHGSSFVVEVSAGYGPNNGINASGGGGQGGVVVVNPNSGGASVSQPFFGLTLRYTTQRCRQYVNVPTALYVSLNTYLYGLINEDGTTKRTFDPAEQTMILFYTTILKQASGCSSSK